MQEAQEIVIYFDEPPPENIFVDIIYKVSNGEIHTYSIFPQSNNRWMSK